jgi:hypothetical protein
MGASPRLSSSIRLGPESIYRRVGKFSITATTKNPTLRNRNQKKRRED